MALGELSAEVNTRSFWSRWGPWRKGRKRVRIIVCRYMLLRSGVRYVYTRTEISLGASVVSMLTEKQECRLVYFVRVFSTPV